MVGVTIDREVGAMEAKCAQCGFRLEVIPGHRPRKYCSDRCRQTACRRRHGKKERSTKRDKELMEALDITREMAIRCPGLEFSTYYTLYEIQKKCGPGLALRTLEDIAREVRRAKQWVAHIF